MRDPRYVRNLEALLRERKEISARRIIGGLAVPSPSFPDCVAVEVDDQWRCSGTLISQNAILTAGHCLCKARKLVPTRVFFGSNVEHRGKIFRVDKIMRHPNYNDKYPTNDMMVLILTDKVPSSVADPRPLAPTKLIDEAKQVQLVGFGDTDESGTSGTKRQTVVPVASTSCEGKVYSMGDEIYYGCFPRIEMVAGQPALKKDTCTGDSGGPLYVSDKKKDWFLAGVTSRAIASRKRQCGDGGIYSRVDQFQKWIESIPN